MWDLRVANPFGRLSIRNMLMLAASILAVIFAYIFLTAPTTYAADASWNGDSITYNGQQYIKQSDVVQGDGSGLQKGTHIYTYTEPTQSEVPGTTQKIHVISFAPTTDPTKATSATLTTYDFTPPSTFTNPTGTQTINISARTADDTKTTSCVVEGIGWIVCPITNFLANAMDWLFSVLTNFLAVRPVQNNQDDALFRAWSIMRNFANVAFVIAFLVIIYSQISNFGISNYGLKKMLPRLVVAAILVNISYWICAVAVDVSNILGFSIEGLFMGMRDNITGAHNNHWDVVSWKSISTAILSGGTLAAGGAISLISTGSIAGAIYMLLPVLVGILIAALVAIVIMAARQALITILIILAPLAFVAYLLPNTEKYFDKWQDTLTTMLVLFPAFAVLFGGSQLAGIAIIQNADSIIMIILGMAVQVAPLVILPLLIKLSGSVIGRIAGIANDKSKGLIDRSRQFAQEQSDFKKSQVLARTDLRRRNALSRAVQGMDNHRRRREGWQKVNEANADNKWSGTAEHKAIDTASREADRVKHILEQEHSTHWNVRARIDPNSLAQELKLRVTADQESASKARLDAMHEEFKTYTDPKTAPAYIQRSPNLSAILADSNDATRDLALTALRKKSAERVQSEQLTQALLKNEERIDGVALREYGGGVGGAVGEASVLASTVSTFRSEYVDRIKEKSQLIKHFNLSSSDRQTLAMGKDVQANKDGLKYIFKANDEFAREAAIDEQLRAGSFDEIENIIKESGAEIEDVVNGVKVKRQGATYDYRTSISQAIPEYKLAGKAAYYGSRAINDIAQGRMNGSAGLDNAAVYQLMNGKLKDEMVASMDAGGLARLFAVANDVDGRAAASQDYRRASPQEIAAFRNNAEVLRQSTVRILENPLLSRSASEAAKRILEANKPPGTP